MYGESTTILLTDKGKEVLLGEDAALYIDNVSDKQLLASDKIDNITRKALMQEIIKGEKPTLNNLVTICSEENISRNSHRKIGYLG